MVDWRDCTEAQWNDLTIDQRVFLWISVRHAVEDNSLPPIPWKYGFFEARRHFSIALTEKAMIASCEKLFESTT